MALPAGPFVVLTREPEDNRELAAALRDRGVPVREIACVATRYLDPGELPGGAGAIAFSSRRAVRGLLRLVDWQGLVQGPRRPLVAAVGTATAAELERAGLVPDLVAAPPEGRVLARMLIARLEPGARIVIPRGNLRAGGMDATLAKAGMVLEPLVVYENLAPEIPASEPFGVAAVFIASPSAGQRLCAALPWIRCAPFFAIGPTTAAAMRSCASGPVKELGPGGTDVWLDPLCAAHQAAI